MELIVNVNSTKLINPDTSLVTGSSVEKKLFEYFKLYYYNLEDEPIGKFSKDVLNIIYSGKLPNDDYGEIYNFYRPIEFVNKVYRILSNIRILILHQCVNPNIINVEFVEWENEIAKYKVVYNEK